MSSASSSSASSSSAPTVVKRKRGAKRPLEFKDWLKFDQDAPPHQRKALESNDTFAYILSFLEPRQLLSVQLVSKGVQHLLQQRSDCFPAAPSRAVIRIARMHKLFAKSFVVPYFHPLYACKSSSVQMPSTLRHLSAGANTALFWLPPKLESLYLYQGVRFYCDYAQFPRTLKRLHCYLTCHSNQSELKLYEGLLELWLPDSVLKILTLPQSLLMLRIGSHSPDLGSLPKQLRWLCVANDYRYPSLKLSRDIEHLELHRMFQEIAWPERLRRLRWTPHQLRLHENDHIHNFQKLIAALPHSVVELSLANAYAMPTSLPPQLVQLSIQFNWYNIVDRPDFSQLATMKSLLFLHLENYNAQLLTELPPNLKVLVLGKQSDPRAFSKLRLPDSIELVLAYPGNVTLLLNAPRTFQVVSIGRAKSAKLQFMRWCHEGCTLKVDYSLSCKLQDNLFVRDCGFALENKQAQLI